MLGGAVDAGVGSDVAGAAGDADRQDPADREGDDVGDASSGAQAGVSRSRRDGRTARRSGRRWWGCWRQDRWWPFLVWWGTCSGNRPPNSPPTKAKVLCLPDAASVRKLGRTRTGHTANISPTDTWGSLISTERPPVPLSRALLASREGLVIGRSTVLCHVELLDSAVSRRHLRLRLEDGGLLVEDLNSSHGTQVDGMDLHPFAPRALQQHGQVIIAGIGFRLSKSVS